MNVAVDTCNRGPITVLRYFISDVTISYMLVSVTASTWRMLVWNCSALSPPSRHWICLGVTYRTREWQHLVTIQGSVTSHLLNVEISLTWDYRCVEIHPHTSRTGERWGGEWSWARGGGRDGTEHRISRKFVLKHCLFREICSFPRVNLEENCDRRHLRTNMRP